MNNLEKQKQYLDYLKKRKAGLKKELFRAIFNLIGLLFYVAFLLMVYYNYYTAR